MATFKSPTIKASKVLGTAETGTVKKKKAAKARATKSKTAAKKAAVRKTATTKQKAKKATSKTTTKRTQKTPAAVSLPNRMPMRAQEKALVLTQMLDRDFYYPALALSRVGGVAFIAIGALLAVTSLPDELFHCHDCVAQVLDSTTVSTGEVVPLAKLPSSISSTVEVPFTVTNTPDVSAYLRFIDNTGASKIISLSVANLGNNKYAAEIRGGVLEPRQYTLKLQVKYPGSINFDVYNYGSFVVPKTTTETTEIVEVSGLPALTSELAQSQANQTQTATDFVLQAPGRVSGIATVNYRSSQTFDSVQFFVRAVQGMNTQTVGSTPGGAGSFALNSYNIPNGTFELFAKGIRSGQTTVLSKPVVIEVFNERSILSSTETSVDQKRQLLELSRELNQELYDSFEGGESVDVTIAQIAEVTLVEDADQLNALLTAYAAATQAGDETLVAAAQDAIDSYQESVIAAALADENDRYIADELDVILAERLDELTQKVDTFEEVRRSRSNSESSIDSDQDGISDLDEIALYGTDPTVADSDGDGFTDGAEIVSGFDPTNAAAEAVIQYESPKETIGTVKTDKLSVAEVTPEIILDSEAKEVHATVRGVALPNSFVTLYMFSTPIVVTVKTDDSGLYEYTFTQELEDGEHQVFAALTDNRGDIIAQSEAFTFLKEAQAFTPVDTAAASAVIAPTADNPGVSSGTSFTVVIGMSVLALGVLLILLGVGLRSNKPDIVAEA